MKKFYAHSTDSKDTTDWQLLEEHLHNVTSKAEEFASFFNGAAWARYLGNYHDLGKSTLQWQAWLRHVNGIIDEFSRYYDGHPTHAFLGAQKLFAQSQEAGKLLAYCVAGHHAGLPDWGCGTRSGLKHRLEQSYPDPMIENIAGTLPTVLPFELEQKRMGYQLQFFIRMLFSCLVDADYLDTENALDAEKAAWRGQYPDITTHAVEFWQNFNKLREKADPESFVNKQREQVLQDCLNVAKQPCGFFSLTVPTGGGKTLASLAFALEHAKQNNLRRIIYVIPFTTIIEQNAAVFRQMLGGDCILEHHSNFFPEDGDWKSRLAAENWDAPVVVTTNVQFFDSFYANKPSKCRKLHNVAKSIVIFDEVQAIPVERLQPCLEVINELVHSYDSSVVLCTATQPAFQASSEFPSGLKEVTEIISDVSSLFSHLKRTEEIYIGSKSVEEISHELEQHHQVLCVVNTRDQALEIFQCLSDSSNIFHLSALMYPQHRSNILKKIRKKLEQGQKCLVISTQLIEAGVDIDFPCVFRAVAGIDSIAQAAGRCNRNGTFAIPSKVFIFSFAEDSAGSFIRHAVQSAQKLFAEHQGNLTAPDCVRAYFRDYFWKNEQRMDEGNTLELCRQGQGLDIQFRELAKFRMINSPTQPVIIALEKESIDLVSKLEFVEHSGGISRKLQKFTVQIYPYQLSEIEKWLETPLPGIYVLKSKEMYSDQTGLRCISPQGEGFFA